MTYLSPLRLARAFARNSAKRSSCVSSSGRPVGVDVQFLDQLACFIEGPVNAKIAPIVLAVMGPTVGPLPPSRRPDAQDEAARDRVSKLAFPAGGNRRGDGSLGKAFGHFVGRPGATLENPRQTIRRKGFSPKP